MFSPPRESRTTPHTQRFCPTCRGFHPPGGLPLICSPQTRLQAQQKGTQRDLACVTPVPPGTSRTSCPVSAASAAAASATAGGAAATGGTPAAGMTAGMTTRVTARVTAAAAGRAPVAAPGPPAAPARAAAHGPAPPATRRRTPLAADPRQLRHEDDDRHAQNQPAQHTTHDLTSFRPPKRGPRFAPIPAWKANARTPTGPKQT